MVPTACRVARMKHGSRRRVHSVARVTSPTARAVMGQGLSPLRGSRSRCLRLPRARALGYTCVAAPRLGRIFHTVSYALGYALSPLRGSYRTISESYPIRLAEVTNNRA
jgi:hypothetical protein